MASRPSLLQELAIRDRVAGDFYDGSDFNRSRLDRAGLGRGITSIDHFRRIAPMQLHDVVSKNDLVLHALASDANAQRRHLHASLVSTIVKGVTVSYSGHDFELLGRLGAELFAMAGVQRDDVIACALAPHHTRELLQISLGASTLGATHMWPAPVEQDVYPNVIVGFADDIAAWLDATSCTSLHTAIVVGGDPEHAALEDIAKRIIQGRDGIVHAWAPAGALSLWGQCRGGTGFHLWDENEYVEIVDPVTGLPVPEGVPGAILWTGIGWYGTAILRLATGAGGVIRKGTCPTCGRRGARIEPVVDVKGFSLSLNNNDVVVDWHAELYRTELIDELVLWVALRSEHDALRVLSLVDREIGDARVQFTSREEVNRRRDVARNERFSDRRAYLQDADDMQEGVMVDG